MSAWVLMAWDGPRWLSESWEPVAVFDHPPTLRERGEALIRASRAGALPWSSLRGHDYDDRMVDTGAGGLRLGQIIDYTDVREVPAR